MLKKTLIIATFILGVASFATAKITTGNEYTNSLGMKFVRIKPGTFVMGVGKTPLPHELTHHRGTQFDGDFDEKPNHKVTITQPFYAGVVEVTNYQYELFDPEHKKLLSMASS